MWSDLARIQTGAHPYIHHKLILKCFELRTPDLSGKMIIILKYTESVGLQVRTWESTCTASREPRISNTFTSLCEVSML